MLRITERQPKTHPVVPSAIKPKAEPAIMNNAVASHPIFGPVFNIDGFALERQHMSVLNYWHKKAIAASKAYFASEPLNKPDTIPNMTSFTM